ncbi:MAG TPA: hypothetical protein VGH13_12650 [Xanthobacteraceae bacterium]|jgi:hypothetical protein
MSDRKALIDSLDVGDIFHAEYPNGASCICRVSSVSDETIHSRRMTTHENLEFGRHTGIERINDGSAQAVINSVAPLPPEIRSVLLTIERKYAPINIEDWNNADLERFKLTAAEKHALIFVADYYAANPLPPP